MLDKSTATKQNNLISNLVMLSIKHKVRLVVESSIQRILNNFSIDLRFSSSLSSYMDRSILLVVLFAFSVAFIPKGSTAAESGKLIKTYSDLSVFNDHEYC